LPSARFGMAGMTFRLMDGALSGSEPDQTGIHQAERSPWSPQTPHTPHAPQEVRDPALNGVRRHGAAMTTTTEFS
jgi:hypothetical protein